MYSFFVGAAEISLLLCIIMIVVLVLQHASDEQKVLILAVCAAFLGCLGSLMEWKSRDLEMALFSMKLQGLGNSFCLFFLFVFLVICFKISVSRKSRIILVTVVLLRALCIFMAGMEELGVLGELYFKEAVLAGSRKSWALEYVWGWGYRLGVCLDLGFMAGSIFCMVKKVFLMSDEERKHLVWLFIGIAMMGLFFLIYTGELFHQFRFVPPSLVLICMFYILMFVRSGMFRIQYFTHLDLLQKLEQGIIIVDAYYNLQEYNHMAAELFPELKELHIGEKISGYFSLMNLLDRNANQHFQKGEAYYKAQVTSIIDKSQIIGYSIFLCDVTETQVYTEELIRLKEEADYSNREKSNFLANMSHEIRTPMNVIIGSTELILREEASDAVLENASTIKQAGQNLLGIINDILDFSKIEAGKMDIVPVDYSLDTMLLDLINMTIVRMGKKELDFIVDVDVELPRYLHGDDIRIKQVIVNLLTNAVKFTESGHIILRMKRLASMPDGGSVLIRIDVEDSGSGIKEENLNHLFDSFSRFDTVKNRAVEGTGLGLAISLMLAKNMDGKLLVESEYGRGSCFSLEVPQKICRNQGNAEAICYKKALVVEKNIQYAKIYEEAFQYMEMEYAIARSEEQFFEMLNRSYDILFVDKEIYNSPLVMGLRADKVVLLDKLESVKKRKEEDILVMKQILVIKLRSILNRTYSRELRASVRAAERKFTAPEARVLIVDDNAVNLKIATGLLKPFELQVDLADSGKKAIAKIEEKDYDIIFMDHMMPEMDGIQTTQRIRSRAGKKYQNVIIVALTANAVNGAKNIFLNSGMQDFLSKPIEMEKMTQVLKKWLPKDKIQELELLDESDIDIQGFDKWKGLANCNGDEKQYQMALKVYAMMSGRFMEEIANDIEQEDLKSMERIVHTFAVESNKVGAVRFAQFLKKYEEQCSNKNMKYVLNNYSFLQKIYQEIADGLQEYVQN